MTSAYPPYLFSAPSVFSVLKENSQLQPGFTAPAKAKAAIFNEPRFPALVAKEIPARNSLYNVLS